MTSNLQGIPTINAYFDEMLSYFIQLPARVDKMVI